MTTPGQPISPEPTPPDPTVPPPAAAAAAALQGPAPNLTPIVVLLLLLVVGAAAAAFLLLKPHVAFINGLAAPVQVSVGGRAPVRVPAGETARLSAPFGRMLVTEWEMIRPLSADSAPMGETIHGSAVVKSPRGTVGVQATTRQGEADYFAPLITNGTSQPLRVLVNAGLQGAMDCGCAVRAGGQRVFIGYYRLYQNSTVQVRGSSGATATFTELGPRVTSADATVGLRFEDKDLRRRLPSPWR